MCWEFLHVYYVINPSCNVYGAYGLWLYIACLEWGSWDGLSLVCEFVCGCSASHSPIVRHVYGFSVWPSPHSPVVRHVYGFFYTAFPTLTRTMYSRTAFSSSHTIYSWVFYTPASTLARTATQLFERSTYSLIWIGLCVPIVRGTISMLCNLAP